MTRVESFAASERADIKHSSRNIVTEARFRGKTADWQHRSTSRVNSRRSAARSRERTVPVCKYTSVTLEHKTSHKGQFYEIEIYE